MCICLICIFHKMLCKASPFETHKEEAGSKEDIFSGIFKLIKMSTNGHYEFNSNFDLC